MRRRAHRAEYGGTSVANPKRIRAVAARALKTQHEGNRVVVISSAMAGETNRLVALAQELDPAGRCQREFDVVVSTGEQVAVALLAMAIHAAGGKARSFLGHQIRILTDSEHCRARIKQIDASALSQALDDGMIPIIAGFQGIDEAGNITTLGRGGSDTSAVAIAAALEADVCEIYTDVDGVCTTDPNVCSDARKIRRITGEEMMELASQGAKVLQIRSVEIATKYGIDLHVRSSFNESEGTMVVHRETEMEQQTVVGVSLDRDQARVTVYGIPFRAGVQSELFRPLAEAGIVVDIIVQNPPVDERTNVSFTVHGSDLERTMRLMEPLVQSQGASRVVSDADLAKVSIVGVGMRSRPGVAQQMFDTLAAAQIKILMITTSEIKVSCLVERARAEDAVRALHQSFRLEAVPQSAQSRC